MALVLADRVLETCTSPGAGAVSLLGATSGYQTFSSGIGDGNTCYYCIADQSGNNWEVGIGTYASAGNTLARTTPISGSAATPVDFSSGSQNVFVTYPAEKSVNLDASGNASALGTISSGTWQGTTVGVPYGGTGLSSFTSGGVFYANSTSSMANGAGFTYDGNNVLLGTATNFSSTDANGSLASAGMAIYPFSSSAGTTNTAIRSSILSLGTGTANDSTKRFYGYVSAPQLNFSSALGTPASGGAYIAPAILSSSATARVYATGLDVNVTRNNANDITTATAGITQGINCSVSSSANLPTTTKIQSVRGVNSTVSVSSGIAQNTVGILSNASNTLTAQGAAITLVAGLSTGSSFTYQGSTNANATATDVAGIYSSGTTVLVNSTTDTGILTVTNAAAFKSGSLTVTNNSTVSALNVTNAYGFYFNGMAVANQGGGSSSLTISNAYGLYLGNVTTSGGATITDRWGVYQSDTSSKNYFAGVTGIGSALQEKTTAVGASDLDMSTGNFFSKTVSGATTFTVSNVPATGTAMSLILDLTNGGSATVNWWTGVTWAGGTAPTLTASGRDSLGFYTYDGGTTWTGLVLGLNLS